jgi:hypothetical protein
MSTKDLSLLKEAYISATQKIPNVLGTSAQSQVDDEVPLISLSVNSNPEEEEMESSHSQDLGCGCGGSVEESEEIFMTKSNLFSIFCHAKKLHSLCESGITMDPWMHQKIAICADSLESVFRSANYEASRQEVSCD